MDLMKMHYEINNFLRENVEEMNDRDVKLLTDLMTEIMKVDLGLKIEHI